MNAGLRRMIEMAALCAAVTFLAGCKQNFALTNRTFVLELGSDVYGNPALYLNDPETVDTSKLSVEPVSPGITVTDNRFVTVGLDYLSVGEYDFVIRQGEETTPFQIKIKDTKPPTLSTPVTELDVTYGQEVDWNSIFHGNDLSGVYYEAPADLSWNTTERDEQIKVRDRFGNSVTQTVHIRVH